MEIKTLMNLVRAIVDENGSACYQPDFDIISKLEETITALQSEIKIAEINCDLNRAASIKYTKIPAIKNEIETVKNRIAVRFLHSTKIVFERFIKDT
jgi:hypothetical protein